MNKSHRMSCLANIATCFMIVLAFFISVFSVYLSDQLTATVSGRVGLQV